MRNSKWQIKYILTCGISILLCITLTLSSTILGAIISFCYAHFFVTPMYQSSASIYVSNTSENENPDSLTSSDLSAALHLVKGYMILAESDSILQKATEELEALYTISELRDAISVKQTKNTVIFEIIVTHADPIETARIANKVSDILCRYGPNIVSGTSAYVIDKARAPTVSCSPNYTENVLTGTGIGAAAGLILSIPIIAICIILIVYFKRKSR